MSALVAEVELKALILRHTVVDEDPFITCLCGDKWMTLTEHAAHVTRAIEKHWLPSHDAEVERKVAERIAAAIEATESFAHGKNETSKTFLIGFGTARRGFAEIARSEVDQHGS